MRKLFLIVALVASSVCASAFDFDGIDLNTPYSKVAQEIAKRGYSYNSDRNCLEGVCQGEKIFLSFNYVDVIKNGMLGQLIVEIPMEGNEEAVFDNVTTIFNVVYHQVKKEGGKVTYQADKDGTQLMVSQKAGFVVLTYNTPFYRHTKR